MCHAFEKTLLLLSYGRIYITSTINISSIRARRTWCVELVWSPFLIFHVLLTTRVFLSSVTSLFKIRSSVHNRKMFWIPSKAICIVYSCVITFLFISCYCKKSYACAAWLTTLFQLQVPLATVGADTPLEKISKLVWTSMSVRTMATATSFAITLR